MSDTTTGTTEPDAGWSDDTPDEEITTADAPAEDTSPEPEDEPKGKAGKDAARYRTQLRDAEATVAVLQARLDAHQIADAERAAATTLADPGDLWLLGTTLADLRDEDGEVDPGKVQAAAEGIAARRPGLRPGRVDLGQGRRGDRTAGGTTWSSVLRGG